MHMLARALTKGLRPLLPKRGLRQKRTRTVEEQGSVIILPLAQRSKFMINLRA
jgi:hypothetical protein